MVTKNPLTMPRKGGSSNNGANKPIQAEQVQQSVLGYMVFAAQIGNLTGLRTVFEEVDKDYSPVHDADQKELITRQLNRAGDKTKIQQPKVPIVRVHSNAARTYLSETFLEGYPLFAVAAKKQYMDAAQMVEAVIALQQRDNGWVAELSKFHLDIAKYNLGAIYTKWDQAKGTKLKHLSVYNVGFDVRVPVNEMAERGEFVYFNEVISRIEFKQMVLDATAANSSYINIPQALASTPTVGGDDWSYFNVPMVDPTALTTAGSGDVSNNGVNWVAWVNNTNVKGNSPKPQSYVLTRLYARILPSEFKMVTAEAPNTPQIYEFLIINGRVLISYKKVDSQHGMLPVIIAQGNDDALGLQTRGVGGNASPFQQISTSMWAAHTNSLRRKLTDRVVYDPTKIDEAQINNPNPSAKIKIKPGATGIPLNQIIMQLPFNDNSTNMIQESKEVFALANQMNGQNAASQGQFQKGNKTRFEYQDVMSNASGDNREVARTLESVFYSRIKKIILSNIVQYMQPTEIASLTGDDTVKFDPITVRDANIRFAMPDGLQSVQEMLSEDGIKNALNTLATVPAIGEDYRVGDVFSHLMQLQGVLINDYKKPPQQVEYEKAQQQWMQMAQLAIQKGQPFNVPQPKPTDYGLNPDMTVNKQQQTAAEPTPGFSRFQTQQQVNQVGAALGKDTGTIGG